jgi:hypothetical protein
MRRAQLQAPSPVVVAASRSRRLGAKLKPAGRTKDYSTIPTMPARHIPQGFVNRSWRLDTRMSPFGIVGKELLCTCCRVRAATPFAFSPLPFHSGEDDCAKVLGQLGCSALP